MYVIDGTKEMKQQEQEEREQQKAILWLRVLSRESQNVIFKDAFTQTETIRKESLKKSIYVGVRVLTNSLH